MKAERVILVPGLGIAGVDLIPLAFRLRGKGYRVSVFWHFIGRPPLEESARRLFDMAGKQREDVVHFVAHSLGGIVALRMLADHPWDRPGRIVTLGTPHAGITAARRFARMPGARVLLGAGLLSATNGEPITIPPDRDLGIVTGSRTRFYGGWLVPGQPNDSIIGVDETRHPGSRARLTVAETHRGLVLKATVAAQIDRFLRAGRFD
jgi:pimeloyl-ACP methyl ester carboxylesterase